MPSAAPTSRTVCGILVKAPRDLNTGGDIEKTALNLANNLTALSSSYGQPFHFVGLEPKPLGVFSFFKELKSLKSQLKQARCLWLHDGYTALCVAAFVLARFANKPIIITLHTDLSSTTHMLNWLYSYALDHLVLRPMLQLADQVTFSSDTIAENYYNQIAFTKPVQIIPNGVDLDAFKPATAEKRHQIRARFALKENQPVALFKGRFTSQQDMQVLHYLALLLPDWRFWLVGNGSYKPEKWCLPNVQTFRKSQRAARAELYQTADFMIAPKTTAGFPVGFQEALACGLPILSSPLTAEASHFAKAHIETADVNPKSPEDTALLWAETLKAKRHELPRADCKPELANIAQLFWDQTKITSYYAEILRGLTKI